MSLALSLTILRILLYCPSCLPISMLRGCLRVSTRALFRSMEELPRQSTLAYAALHHIFSFHTTSSLPQPISETSHISTCTACHRTCTTSVASDAFFCSWIMTMSLFDWLSFCQGLDLGGLLPPQALMALTCYHVQNCTKVPRNNVPDNVPRPQTLRPRSYSLVIRPPVRLPLALPWSAYIRIHGISSSILQSFFSNRWNTNLEHGYPHCRLKTK